MSTPPRGYVRSRLLHMKMSANKSRKRATGVAAGHTATATKANKTLAVINYFRRKFKKPAPVVTGPYIPPSKTTTVETLESYPAFAKKCIEVQKYNKYQLLADVGESDNINVEMTCDFGDVELTAAEIKPTDLFDIGVIKGIELSPPKRVKTTKLVYFDDQGTQSCETRQIQANDPVPDISKEMETVPSRAVAKVAAKRKCRFIYSQLLNFLRCKHFMHYRDHHFITTLVADARAWMLANKHTMDTPLHFSIISMAVTQAFMVNQAELDFRARLKPKTIQDHLSHHNKAMTGDLGNVFLLKNIDVEAKNWLKKPFLKNVRMPIPQTPVV